MKICPKCKINKDVSAYQKNRASLDGLQYHCKSCRKEIDARPEHREADRKRYHEKKDMWLNRNLKNTYGISLNQYNEMLSKQNGVCAICEQLCPTGRKLAVDHCHKTGKVRGLLCVHCNQGLGHFKDNIILIQRAIQFLDKV